MTRDELDAMLKQVDYKIEIDAKEGYEAPLARLLKAALAVVDAERDDHTRDPEPECPACGALVAFDAALSGESA